MIHRNYNVVTSIFGGGGEIRSQIIFSPTLKNFCYPGSRPRLLARHPLRPSSSLPGNVFSTCNYACVQIVAEAERFELSVGCPTHAFQACALDHYATPPFIFILLQLRQTRTLPRRGPFGVRRLRVCSYRIYLRNFQEK